MTVEEIKANSGFRHFAEMLLAGCEVEEGREIETCVKLDFDGDFQEFAKTAHRFLSGGFGVAG